MNKGKKTSIVGKMFAEATTVSMSKRPRVAPIPPDASAKSDLAISTISTKVETGIAGLQSEGLNTTTKTTTKTKTSVSIVANPVQISSSVDSMHKLSSTPGVSERNSDQDPKHTERQKDSQLHSCTLSNYLTQMIVAFFDCW